MEPRLCDGDRFSRRQCSTLLYRRLYSEIKMLLSPKLTDPVAVLSLSFEKADMFKQIIVQ